MLDSVLVPLIRTTLRAGLVANGLGAINTEASYQPTQQGANSAPTLYLYKIGPDKRIGSPDRAGVQGTGAAAFTGSITGSVLTVTALASGELLPNQQVLGTGIPDGIVITNGISGTGGNGTYQLNQALPTPVTSRAMTSIAAYVWTETQQYTSTFQISGLATQDPKTPNQLTASDICNYAAAVLQSQNAIDAFEAQGVGILNITDIRNPYFSDDRQQYEASPNFDFTLTVKQQIITTTPTVFETEFQVLRV